MLAPSGAVHQGTMMKRGEGDADVAMARLLEADR